jgi:hypothetical protein
MNARALLLASARKPGCVGILLSSRLLASLRNAQQARWHGRLRAPTRGRDGPLALTVAAARAPAWMTSPYASHIYMVYTRYTRYTRQRELQPALAQWPPHMQALMVMGREPLYGARATSPRVMRRGPTGGPPALGRMSCGRAREGVF